MKRKLSFIAFIVGVFIVTSTPITTEGHTGPLKLGAFKSAFTVPGPGSEYTPEFDDEGEVTGGSWTGGVEMEMWNDGNGDLWTVDCDNNWKKRSPCRDCVMVKIEGKKVKHD